MVGMQHDGARPKLLIHIKRAPPAIQKMTALLAIGGGGSLAIHKRAVEGQRHIGQPRLLQRLLGHKIGLIGVNGQLHARACLADGANHVQQEIIVVIMDTVGSVDNLMHKSYTPFRFQQSVDCALASFSISSRSVMPLRYPRTTSSSPCHSGSVGHCPLRGQAFGACSRQATGASEPSVTHRI